MNKESDGDDMLFGRSGAGTVLEKPYPDPETSAWPRGLSCGRWKEAPLRFVPKLGPWHRAYMARLADYLEVRTSRIRGAGSGVFAKRDIPPGLRLPYIGVVFYDDRDTKGDGTYNMWCGDSRHNIHGAVDGDPARTTKLNNFAPRINEPPRSTPRLRANVDMRVFCDTDWNPATPCMLYTTRYIKKGEELYMDYGEEYLDRDAHYGPAEREVIVVDHAMLE